MLVSENNFFSMLTDIITATDYIYLIIGLKFSADEMHKGRPGDGK